MLQIRNGRFHANGVSFLIPDGCFIIADEQITDGTALSAWSEDMTTHYMWEIYDYDKNPLDEIESTLKPETGCQSISDIMAVQINGLTGYAIFYRGRRIQAYQAVFTIPAGGHMVLTVEVTDLDIMEISKTDHFRAALAGIELDSERQTVVRDETWEK